MTHTHEFTMDDLFSKDRTPVFPKGYKAGKPYKAPGPSVPEGRGSVVERSKKISLEERMYDAVHDVVQGTADVITHDTKAVAHAIGQGSKKLTAATFELAKAFETYISLKEFPELHDHIRARNLELAMENVNKLENNQAKIIKLPFPKEEQHIHIPNIILCRELTPLQAAIAAPINYKTAVPAEDDYNPLHALFGIAVATTILGYAAFAPKYMNALRTTANTIEKVIISPFSHTSSAPSLPKIPDLTPSLPNGKYILLGDFISQDNAKSFAQDLTQNGIDTTNLTPIKTTKGNRYRLSTSEKNIERIAEVYGTPNIISINAQDGKQKTTTLSIANKSLGHEQQIKKYLAQSAAQYHVRLNHSQLNDLILQIKGIIMQESAGALGVRGYSDDTGRMQVIPETAYLIEYSKEDRTRIDKDPKLKERTLKELSDRLLMPGEDIRIGTKVFMSNYANWYNKTHNHAKSKNIATAEYNRGNEGLAELSISESRASRYVAGVNKFYVQFLNKKAS